MPTNMLFDVYEGEEGKEKFIKRCFSRDEANQEKERIAAENPQTRVVIQRRKLVFNCWTPNDILSM